MDVILVSMPFAEVQRPSIALGLLRAAMEDSPLTCEVVYGNFDFAETIGIVNYQALQASPADHLVGEWCFSKGLIPGADPDDDAFLESALDVRTPGFPPTREERIAVVKWCRDQTSRYLDDLADHIVSRRPRIVGSSSVFQQHCASLALLRRIRERSEDIVTVLGGANCEGEMGLETLRVFPWLDCAVSGEADGFFREMCELFAEHGREPEADALPYGVRTQGTLDGPACNGSEPARSIVRNLDDLPTPHYDDYFTALRASSLAGLIQPGLLAESSRGCWWGERSHCTFCGLNGVGMAYRSKSAERVCAEIAELTERYALRNIQFVDNILDMSHIDSVLGELAHADPPYSLFYETKANLKRPQVRALARAGVRWIQPGIESLDNRVLKLIGKGNSALMNLQLLKWSLEYGIHASWNFLAGLPGEEDAWYAEIAEWLPHVYHLQPPSGVTRVRYDRFSPYQMRPDAYGLSLVPSRAYEHVYPLPRESLMRLAYFFEDASDRRHVHRAIQDKPGIRRLQQAVLEWVDLWSRGTPPSLQIVENGHGAIVTDTRPYAVERAWRLTETEVALHRFCDVARTPETVAGEFPDCEKQVRRLVTHRLLLPLNGRLLGLAVTPGAASEEPTPQSACREPERNRSPIGSRQDRAAGSLSLA